MCRCRVGEWEREMGGEEISTFTTFTQPSNYLCYVHYFHSTIELSLLVAYAGMMAAAPENASPSIFLIYELLCVCQHPPIQAALPSSSYMLSCALSNGSFDNPNNNRTCRISRSAAWPPRRSRSRKACGAGLGEPTRQLVCLRSVP